MSYRHCSLPRSTGVVSSYLRLKRYSFRNTSSRSNFRHDSSPEFQCRRVQLSVMLKVEVIDRHKQFEVAPRNVNDDAYLITHHSPVFFSFSY